MDHAREQEHQNISRIGIRPAISPASRFPRNEPSPEVATSKQGLGAGPQMAGRPAVEEDLPADGEAGDAGAVQQGPGHGEPERRAEGQAEEPERTRRRSPGPASP